MRRHDLETVIFGLLEDVLPEDVASLEAVGRMDGECNLLTRIRESLAAYDDALAALASKGLLRRAQKDLEDLAPEIVGEVENKLRVKLGDVVVDVQEVPNQSTCDCPSSGICRHILTVLPFLWKAEIAPAPSMPREEEMSSIDDESLRVSAGRLVVEPVSLYGPRGQVNLTLDMIALARLLEVTGRRIGKRSWMNRAMKTLCPRRLRLLSAC